MKFLFVHQAFPGQYRHVIAALLKQGGHQLVGMGQVDPVHHLPKNLAYIRYGLDRGTTKTAHPWSQEFESKLIRGEAAAIAAHHLKAQGFTPDLICAHPGWGESLFLRDIWPAVPQLHYQEFWYQAKGFDSDFDPEFGTNQPAEPDWCNLGRSRAKNAHLHLAMESANWSVCPTQFQRSSFPHRHQPSISVIHDGIDLSRTLLVDQSSAPPLQLPDGTQLLQGDPIVTFVNRTLEPYRGCHTFLRSLPTILAAQPDARIVIVGATEGVSYGAAAPQGSWKDMFWPQIAPQLDSSRVHFTGPLPHNQLLALFRLSQAHVYLTYPFVLSWSLLEAMACGAPVVGSRTAPVEEVLEHDMNGLLVDFFDPEAVAQAVLALLSEGGLRQRLGGQARTLIQQHYSLRDCVGRHLQLMNLVATGALSTSVA